ncbi:MAG: HAD family phosphatase [Pirellulales bacterium]
MSQLAVIFDMDGVLIDSYAAHFAGWKQMYRELSVDYSEQEFAADFGRTSRDILHRRFGDAIASDRIRELDERKEALFRDSLRAKFTPMDGALELIDSLAADGFLLAVGSSAPPENIDLCLEKLGRRVKFGAIVTGLDVTRGKPDPQVFLTAAEKLGVPPQCCAVVEDAVHGIEAANRAGMVSIALTGTANHEQLSNARLIVDNLSELTTDRIRELVGRRA